MVTKKIEISLIKVLLLKMNEIKSPIPILKKLKIVNIWEQKDTRSSTVNNDSATKSSIATKLNILILEYLN